MVGAQHQIISNSNTPPYLVEWREKRIAGMWPQQGNDMAGGVQVALEAVAIEQDGAGREASRQWYVVIEQP